MTQPMIRSYWVSSALEFVRSHFSAQTSERLINGLPHEIRTTLVGGESAIWYPRSYHIELMSAIASVRKDESGAYDDLLAYGAYAGTQVKEGMLKPFMQVVSLKLFAKRLGVIWSRDHQDDTVLESDIAPLDDRKLPIRIIGTRGYDHVAIAKLGWLKSTVAHFVSEPVHIKQSGWTLNRPGPNEVLLEVSW